VSRESHALSDTGETIALLPEEPIARFLCSRSWFSRESGRVKYSAFMPRDRATSVFRIVGLGDPEVWDMGRRLVAEPSDRTLYGHAALKAVDVQSCRLIFQADDRPPRHAEILGWPEEKGAQRFAAERLAAHSVLRLLGRDSRS
jgi:hypothetical protein